jgi:ribosomal-protein-alanine N-acetyltransferase
MNAGWPLTRSGASAPETIETERLELRRPLPADAPVIYTRYASDADVTRYLGWPRHTALDDTRVFIGFSDGEWRKWGCGPYLTFSHAGDLLGSTGLAFESPDVASTGYLLSRDSWGRGYATEMLRAMIDLAQALEVRRVYALCHVDHRSSQRVMEKGGLTFEGVLPRHMMFPNLGPDHADVLCYARTF